MPGVIVRPATRQDVARIVDLWAAEGGPTRTPPTLEAIERLIDFDGDALVVAETAGDIVGTIVIGWDGWRCHLYRLAVVADHRRRGIATDLVHAAFVRAEALGARRVDAMVNASNEGAQGFWRHAGFEHDADERWSVVLPRDTP